MIRLRVFCLILTICLLALPARGNVYVEKNNDLITAGNRFYEVTFRAGNGEFHPLQFKNKLSGFIYRLSGDFFGLTVTYIGEDITPPKNSPTRLFTSDFSLQNFSSVQTADGQVLKFEFIKDALAVKLTIELSNKTPQLKTTLEVRDIWESSIFLEKISPLILHIPGVQFNFGGFGQPVFADDFFSVLEFPAGYTKKTDAGKIRVWHYVGEKLSHSASYRSHRAVIGFTRNGLVRRDFLAYIESLRPRKTAPFTLYNTWYDIRDFSYEKLFTTMDNFKKSLIDRYNLKLDAFVIDDGWDNLDSVWEIDYTKLPQGFTPLTRKIKKAGSNLGLWISPWNGYDKAVKKRVAWAVKAGYETSGSHLCLGGKKYFRTFKKKVINHLKEGDLSFYKIDGFLSACNERNHEHLPGIYSREFLTGRFIEVLKEIRKVQPDIFIDITVGTWLSPWWLMYADAVWMTGADFGHAEDVPAFSERDKAITFRDYTLYKDFVRDGLQFPLANVMTHGIIKGKLNLLGGKDETLRNWQDNTVMYFSRGVMMWELYISPEMLSTAEWDFMAAMMKWSKANEDLLMNTRFIGGNPYEREVYGYFHEGADQSILIVRNPFVRTRKISFTTDELFRVNKNGSYAAEQLYPLEYIHSSLFSGQNTLNLTLAGYEVKVLRLTAAGNERVPSLAGVPLNKLGPDGNKMTIELFDDPLENNCLEIQNEESISELYLNDRKIDADELKRFICKANNHGKYKFQSAINLESISRNSVAGTITFADSLHVFDGRLGILLDFKSAGTELKVSIDNQADEKDYSVKKGANGLWYWILVPLENGSRTFRFTITEKNGGLMPEGNISVHAIGKIKLQSLGKVTIKSKTDFIAEQYTIPVQPGVRNILQTLFSGKI